MVNAVLAMDLLSDVLEQAGLRRRLLDLRGLEADAALRFPCSKSIGFHVVTQGQVFIHAETLAAPLALRAGDVALMARGCDHVLSVQAVLSTEARAAAAVAMPLAAGTGVETPASAVISGAYQFWNTPVHPFFAELPDWYVLRATSISRLNPLSLTIALLGAESGKPDLGSGTIVNGLLDVSFAYLLREIMAQTGSSSAGWSQGLRDAKVRQAVELMHADLARDWTLEALARRVGLSRTALARRFRETMGGTPLNYLCTVRMQRAMRLLDERDGTLEMVAAEVGYQDAFGFSKAFKRTVGITPREFRRRDAVDKTAAFRF